ncbi:MAG: hypothetical protein AMXMBFR64_47770 [Myxococcales bacterium]
MARLILVFGALALVACTYEPPPVVDLERPAGAVFELGSPLVLKFSEPIDAATLAVRVWAGDRDQEQELKRGTKPKLDTCRPSSSCGKNTLTVAKDRLSATLVLDPDGAGKVDVPLVLEVLAGLKGPSRTLTIPVWFDFQFAPPLPAVGADAGADGEAARPMEFKNGIYVILAQIDKPLPAVLTLLADFRVLPDGRGAFAGAEGDEIGKDTPKNTDDPTKLKIDTTKEGYTVFVSSRFDWDGDNRIMTGDPVDVKVYVGPLTVYLKAVRLKGFVIADGGNDRIEGTLSFEGVTLTTGDQSVDYDANSTTFTAKWVPPEHVPAGTPDLCKDLCGAVKDGICEPPADFPHADFCL